MGPVYIFYSRMYGSLLWEATLIPLLLTDVGHQHNYTTALKGCIYEKPFPLLCSSVYFRMGPVYM